MGVIGFQGNMTKKIMKRRLNSSFELEPELCKVVWDARIESGYVGSNPRPKHFFDHSLFKGIRDRRKQCITCWSG